MTKKIFLMCLIGLMCATSSYAGCDGGIAVAGFCKSNVKMNWWSAAAWCKGNAMQLATIYEMCPSWNGVPDTYACPGIWDFDGIVWSGTSVPDDSEKAFYLMATYTIGSATKSSGAFSTICH